jgi:hypothetical protein
MLHTIRICYALLGHDGGPVDATKPDRIAYDAAAAKAAKSPVAHVQLALWCEAHGMTAPPTTSATTPSPTAATSPTSTPRSSTSWASTQVPFSCDDPACPAV